MDIISLYRNVNIDSNELLHNYTRVSLSGRSWVVLNETIVYKGPQHISSERGLKMNYLYVFIEEVKLNN